MAKKVLWIGGSKYKLEPPNNEPDEFQINVEKYIQDIFGKDSIYIKPLKLESLGGRVKIPDGFVITFNFNTPQLYIIEYEISKKLDRSYNHTLGQLITFNNSFKRDKTKIDLIDKFTSEIKKDKIKTDIALKKYGEIAQLTQDIVKQENPKIIIIIDSLDEQIKEVFDELHPHPHYIEFQTFKHGEKEAYVFDRMYEEPSQSPEDDGEKVYVEFDEPEPSHKKGIMEERYEKIEKALRDCPLTYKEILDAVPELNDCKKPINSLWSIIEKYGIDAGKIEKTKDKPLKLKLI